MSPKAIGFSLSAILCALAAPEVRAQVTVTVLQPIDSSKPAAQYGATVKTAATVGNTAVPAGSSAVLKLAQPSAGNWTLTLVSVTANGQVVPVGAGSPVLAGGVGALSNTASQARQAVSGIIGGFGGGKKQAAANPNNAGSTTPTVSGPRIYVPTGMDVQFQLAGATAAPANRAAVQPVTPVAAPAGGAVTPAAPAPAAGPPQANFTPNATGQQPPAQAQAVAASTPVQTSNTVLYEGIQYQLQSCKREAPHIVCSVQITNTGGSDVKLFGGQQTHFFDQSGNRQGITMKSIANCAGWGFCDLLPSIPMAGRFEFLDQDNRATTLVRLQIWENNKAVAQFNNVAIQ